MRPRSRQSRVAGCRSDVGAAPGVLPGPAPGLATTTYYDDSVRRLARVDLVDPGDHAAAHVHGVGEAGALGDRQHLGRADTGLAVEHQLLVLRQLLQRDAGLEVRL